jgi:predicted AlkP superfamily pyrophosphatase or phosphodiesterase
LQLLRFFLAALALPALLAAQVPHKLVVISIDGLDARFLSEPALRVKAPNIRRLMRNGASASGVIGVAPSDSWPAHASLATGAPPFENGITGNYAPHGAAESFASASAIRSETLWDAATAAGLKTAVVYWPSTLGARVAFDFPEYWETRQGNAIDLQPIVEHARPPGIASLIEQMFPGFEKQLWDDSSSAMAAQWLLAKEKPDLLMVHMAEVDAEQHDTGALSVYARDMVENDDDMIAQIIARAPARTVFAVVSDHGFENQNYLVRPRVMLKRAGIAGDVEVADGLIGTPDARVARYLRRVLAEPRRSGLAREIPMAEVTAKAPALSRWIAAFDTLPNYVASNEDHGPALGPGSHLGIHGLWPTRPGYRSVFILSGEDVTTARWGEIDMLRIAPSLASILGLRLKDAKQPALPVAVR